MKKTRSFAELVALLVCFVLIFINALYFVSQKEDFFLDEKWTFLFANNKVVSFGDFIYRIQESKFDFDAVASEITDKAIPANGNVMTLDDVNAMMSAQDGNKFTPFSTMLYSTSDSHPPFYYLIFNFINSAIPGISLRNTGFLINIIVLLLTCLLIYKIAVLYESKLCGIIAVLFYGLSFEFINNVTYFRMYALLTLEITLILHLYLKWAISDYSYAEKKYLNAILAAELITMLTQYLAAVYILPVFIITIIFLGTYKISAKRYIVKHIWLAIIYTVLWPFSVYRFIADESGRDVRNTASLLNIPNRVAKYIRILVDSLFAGSKKYFIFVMAVIAVYFILGTIQLVRDRKAFISANNKEVECFIYLMVPTAFFYIVISDIAPWTVDRYMMPIIAVVSLIIVVLFWRSLKWFIKNEWICAGLMGLMIVISFVRVHGMTPNYLYPVNAEQKAFIEAFEGKSAFVVEPDDQIEFVDLFLSVDHPYWMIVKKKDLNEHLKKMNNSYDSYVFYVNSFCDQDEVIKVFGENGANLEKNDYKKEFYDIYYIR